MENKHELTAEEFIFLTPLYKPIKWTWQNGGDPVIKNVLFFNGQIDAYCIECGKESTFRRSNPPNSYDDYSEERDPISEMEFYMYCIRNHNHEIEIILKHDGNSFQKIGQYPSPFLLNQGNSIKYKTILGKKYNEFNKAIGLWSYHFGIGAFVYLRRIFEDWIEQAHQEAKSWEDWSEELYFKQSMEEKIKLLKNILPKFLVDNRALYSVLSKGIHELEEDECYNIFPTAKKCIEMVLNEKMTKEKEENDKKEAAHLLREFQKKFPNKS